MTLNFLQYIIVALTLTILVTGCENPGSLLNIGSDDLIGDVRKQYTVRLTGVEIKPVEKKVDGDTTRYYQSDTLRNQIVFNAVPQYEVVDSTTMESENGDQDNYNILNPVSMQSADPVLTFNKRIKIQELKIKPFKNLLEMDVLDDVIRFPKRLDPDGIGQIRIDKERIKIDRDTYRVRASWHNVEGEVFTDSVKVFIDI